MRPVVTLLVLLAVLPLMAHAADTEKIPRVWKYSAVAMVAATSLDAASSYGLYERNPVLRSPGATFGARGSLIKLGIAGASLGLQYAFRHHPGALKRAAVLNFIQAGVYAGAGAYNLGVTRR